MPVGEKFAFIVFPREADYFKRFLKQKMPSQDLFPQDLTPAPEFALRRVPLDQFLSAYTNLCQCAVALDKNLPSAFFDFRSRKSLTKAEALYAMDLLLAANGMEIINDGHAFILVKRKESSH